MGPWILGDQLVDALVGRPRHVARLLLHEHVRLDNGLVAPGDVAAVVAAAPMSTLWMPKNDAISVGTGFERAAVRKTWTRTRLGFPAGSFRNVTSPGSTATSAPIT